MARRAIDGRRALVTGASRGIGRALALVLAQHGAELLLTARREAELHKLAQEITASGGRAEIVVGDICDPTVRQRVVERASAPVHEQGLGGLDFLVNNAGVSGHGRFDDASPERLRKIMEVNFFSAVELTRLSLPLLKQGRDPAIVNIGSILGHRGIPFNSEYCASKFALRGFTESLRTELAPDGISVLLVSPGSTDTDLFDHLIETDMETPWGHRKGVPAAHVAQVTVNALRSGRREIVPSRQGRWLLRLNRWAPGLVDRIMNRFGSK